MTEAVGEEGDGEEGSVAASDDAMLARPESPPNPEPFCSCSPDVTPDWLRAFIVEEEVSMGDAIELLNQAENFDTVCRRHKEKLGAVLGIRPMRGAELEQALTVIRHEQHNF